MKHITSTIALIFLGLFLSSPTPVSASPASPEPRNATEAVFFASGMVEAQIEGVALELERSTSVIPVPAGHIGFREMAYCNGLIALLAQQQGFTVTAFYFWGRAAAFHQMADLEDEGLL